MRGMDKEKSIHHRKRVDANSQNAQHDHLGKGAGIVMSDTDKWEMAKQSKHMGYANANKNSINSSMVGQQAPPRPLVHQQPQYEHISRQYVGGSEPVRGKQHAHGRQDEWGANKPDSWENKKARDYNSNGHRDNIQNGGMVPDNQEKPRGKAHLPASAQADHFVNNGAAQDPARVARKAMVNNHPGDHMSGAGAQLPEDAVYKRQRQPGSGPNARKDHMSNGMNPGDTNSMHNRGIKVVAGQNVNSDHFDGAGLGVQAGSSNQPHSKKHFKGPADQLQNNMVGSIPQQKASGIRFASVHNGASQLGVGLTMPETSDNPHLTSYQLERLQRHNTRITPSPLPQGGNYAAVPNPTEWSTEASAVMGREGEIIHKNAAKATDYRNPITQRGTSYDSHLGREEGEAARLKEKRRAPKTPERFSTSYEAKWGREKQVVVNNVEKARNRFDYKDNRPVPAREIVASY